MGEITKEQITYLKKYVKNKDISVAIEELKKGIPIQYVVGNVEFYNSVINVDENGYYTASSLKKKSWLFCLASNFGINIVPS